MKKITTVLLIFVLALSSFSITANAAEKQRNQVVGFFAGCCFGIRCAGDYNEGKDIHFREWIRLIPIANLVGAIMDGVDGANGTTNKDLVEKYGATYY